MEWLLPNLRNCRSLQVLTLDFVQYQLEGYDGFEAVCERNLNANIHIVLAAPPTLPIVKLCFPCGIDVQLEGATAIHGTCSSWALMDDALAQIRDLRAVSCVLLRAVPQNQYTAAPSPPSARLLRRIENLLPKAAAAGLLSFSVVSAAFPFPLHAVL